MAEHGEGLFLLSLEVDELISAIERCNSSGAVVPTGPRKGLEDWEVIDLDPVYFMGASLQLVATGK